MSENYFQDTDNKELQSKYMISLVEGLVEEKGLVVSPEEKNEVGIKLSMEWEEGKTDLDKSDILFEKFGTEEEKAAYAAWNTEKANKG
jgi:hypothetical protein